MIFRDFVEVTRDALQALAFGLEGDRDVTPMLHLESLFGISTVAVDAGFFDTPEAVELLARRYVVPLVRENRARKLAWTYCAWSAPDDGGGRPSEHPDRRELLLATFIDPEVVEHWGAPIIRTGGPVLIGNWFSSVRQVGEAPFITAIQHALR